MKTQNSTNVQPVVKYMLAGAAIATGLILSFLFGAGNPNPQWGNYWMVKPLVMVPTAGLAGGAVYYFITSKLSKAITKIPAAILGLIVFVFILWVGTVLGLNGTYWD